MANVSVDQILMFLGEEAVKNRLLERENAALKAELEKARKGQANDKQE